MPLSDMNLYISANNVFILDQNIAIEKSHYIDKYRKWFNVPEKHCGVPCFASVARATHPWPKYISLKEILLNGQTPKCNIKEISGLSCSRQLNKLFFSFYYIFIPAWFNCVCLQRFPRLPHQSQPLLVSIATWLDWLWTNGAGKNVLCRCSFRIHHFK